jgi:hypothetical protein
VEFVEGVGDTVHAHLRTGVHRLVARFPSGTRLRAGQRLGVDAGPGRWYLFDAVSGRTLRHAP